MVLSGLELHSVAVVTSHCPVEYTPAIHFDFRPFHHWWQLVPSIDLTGVARKVIPDVPISGGSRILLWGYHCSVSFLPHPFRPYSSSGDPIVFHLPFIFKISPHSSNHPYPASPSHSSPHLSALSILTLKLQITINLCLIGDTLEAKSAVKWITHDCIQRRL